MKRIQTSPFDNGDYEFVGIRQSVQCGYIVCSIPGVFDIAYPTSNNRRGRVQGDGHISPTITSEGQTLVKIIKWNKTRYIASFSGGKDSVATIILAHEHNEPLDLIIFAEVMYNDEISGELPEHIDFVKNVCFPLFESWGYKTKILHANYTYEKYFYHEVKNAKTPDRNGKRAGFPMAGRCDINKRCKIGAIRKFYQSQKDKKIVQYLGIATDEPKRLKRMQGTNKVSLLSKYGYTEEMAKTLCVQYGLLSPLYSFAKRGGCWFCPNAGDKQLKYLRKKHPDLWNILLSLEKENNLVGNIWNTLSQTSIADKEKQFQIEDMQLVWDFLREDEE